MPELIQRKGLEITEIFSSIQGEGLRMGERHLFVRFKECNLNCSYCDEPFDFVLRPCLGRSLSVVEGSAQGERYKAEVLTTKEITRRIIELDKNEGPHSFVSLTGGEPLCYASAFAGLIGELRKQSFRIYLETNGTLPDEFTSVCDLVDVVAMDIKLPSVGGTQELWEEHRRFLSIAKSKEIFVKIVISNAVSIKEFEIACDITSSVSCDIPLVLQPEDSEFFSDQRGKLLALIRELQALASRKLSDVRILPRLHKVLGIR